MSRAKYHKLIKKIDEQFMNEPPQRCHTYACEEEISSELKKVLIEEYSPHWSSVYIYKKFMYVSTVPLQEQPVLTHNEITTILNSSKWSFEYNPGGFYGVRSSRKKGAA